MYKTSFFSLAFVLLAMGNAGMAQEKYPWGHESEVGIVKVSGNTDTASYNAQQKTVYVAGPEAVSFAGRYQESQSAGTEIGKSWEVSLRFEHAFSDLWTMFVQQGAESNTYAGYLQRDNSDFGGKYSFIKLADEHFFSEAGYRYTKTTPAIGREFRNESFGRLYLEYFRKLNDSVSAKLWVEYLPNFKESKAYWINYEPSMTVMMNAVFSIKVSYQVKYHNLKTTPSEKKEDSTFATTLVAKF